MSTVSVRYFVDDLDTAVDFYEHRLGFDLEIRSGPAFAMLYKGDLRLLLSVPGNGTGGGSAMPDGTLPEPGGWNRFTLQVDDLEREVQRLRDEGVEFKTVILKGFGVNQALAVDPSGNLIELFEPAAGYHERAASTTA